MNVRLMLLSFLVSKEMEGEAKLIFEVSQQTWWEAVEPLPTRALNVHRLANFGLITWRFTQQLRFSWKFYALDNDAFWGNALLDLQMPCPSGLPVHRSDEKSLVDHFYSCFYIPINRSLYKCFDQSGAQTFHIVSHFQMNANLAFFAQKHFNISDHLQGQIAVLCIISVFSKLH